MEISSTWLATTPFRNFESMQIFKKTRTATLLSIGVNVTITVEGPDEQMAKVLEIFESLQGPLVAVQLANVNSPLVVSPAKTSSKKKGCCGGNGV